MAKARSKATKSKASATKSKANKALKDAQGILHALASALQTYALYPPRHPGRQASIDDVAARLRGLCKVADEAPVLMVAHHSFYLGPALLAKESLTLTRLVETFERGGIEAVEIFPDVSDVDIDTLVRLLIGDKVGTAELTGIAVNRVRPTVDGEKPKVQNEPLTELLSTYDSGLELCRQTAQGLAEGRPVAIEATRKLVEQIATKVTEDPVQALLVSTIKSFDEYTYHHMMNVCLLSMALGHAIGLQQRQIVMLGVGGLLHDIGKIKTPVEVLHHKGALSAEQRRVMERHPIAGAGLVFVASRDLYHPATPIALEHHAGYSMTGYPKLNYPGPPSMPARIIAVTDCFDALTSNRPYRQLDDRRQALNILQAEAGTKFDPRIVRAFARLLGIYPVGSVVRLSSGDVGVVVRNEDAAVAHPVVEILLDDHGNPHEGGTIDLTDRDPDGSPRLTIEETMAPEHAGIDMATLLRLRLLSRS